MWQYRPTDELMHYGVIGMKWGHRRTGYDTASSTNRRIKKDPSKSRQTVKAENKALRAEVMKQKDAFNKKVNSYNAKRTKGHKFATYMLGSAFGNNVYAAARLNGKSKGQAIAITALSGIGGPISNIYTYEHYRQKAINAKIKK